MPAKHAHLSSNLTSASIVNGPSVQPGVDAALLRHHLKLCVGLHRLQFEEGRPDSGSGTHEASQGASASSLEADLRRSNESREELVQVLQRSLLDSGARRLNNAEAQFSGLLPYRNVRLGADSVSKADGQCSNHCVPADAIQPRIIATNVEHLPIASSFPSSRSHRSWVTGATSEDSLPCEFCRSFKNLSVRHAADALYIGNVVARP